MNEYTLEEIMKFKKFCVVGAVDDESKHAYKIVKTLKENNYNVVTTTKAQSINQNNIDVINLCIHPAVGIKLIKECNVEYKVVLIQPGAESEEIINHLKNNKIPYLQGCSLIGVTLL